VREAKARPSELLDGVAAGEHVTIRRRNEIVARLVPPPPRRQPARLRGKVWSAPDFDETAPDIIEMMEGSHHSWSLSEKTSRTDRLIEVAAHTDHVPGRGVVAGGHQRFSGEVGLLPST